MDLLKAGNVQLHFSESSFESILFKLWQQKLQELDARISELTAELAKATENKQQLELDYSSKCEAFESLSAEFLAEKVSFEVSRRLRITVLPYDGTTNGAYTQSLFCQSVWMLSSLKSTKYKNVKSCS